MTPGANTADPIVPIPPATTLDYNQSYALMNNFDFRGRVQVACLSYAQYITLEPSNAPAHNTRLRWANSVFQNPNQVANQTTPPVVMNPNVQQAGSAVTDESLQAAVQAVVDEFM